MRPTSSAFVAVAFAAFSLLLLSPGSPVRSQDEIQKVLVMNFPQTQQVAGSVSVEGVVRHATLQRLREVLVSPVSPEETTRMVQAGVIATDGFTSVVLSLNGQMKSKAVKPGAVGAILIPDEESVVRAFEEDGRAQFAIEIAAKPVTGASTHFASTPGRTTLAFPRYRVFLYNTTDKTATVNVYAYLVN